MGVFNTIRNEINAAIGYQQTFVELIRNGDISRAIRMMEDRSEQAEKNIREYNTSSHKIMERGPKIIRDKNGDFIKSKDLNKIAIPYPLYINEVALVFMYGRPVKWIDGTPQPRRDERIALEEERKTLEEGDARMAEIDAILNEIDKEQGVMQERFSKFKETLTAARFDAHIREAKRVAGIEGCSAMLYHVYRENNEPKLTIKVLSKQEDDDIYTLFDQYNRLVAFAWGYNTVDAANKVVHHYDIYMSDYQWKCEQRGFGGWTVKEEKNLIGKIPVIVMVQKKEWDQVESMIERVEKAYSSVADSNDRYSDPKLVATSEILNKNKLLKQEEESNVFVLKNGGDLKYLERTDNNEARNSEIEKLDDQILSKSFTPNLTMEMLKGLGQASGRMLQQYMILADIKAAKHKEKHDEYLSRTSSLMIAIMDNIMDIPHKGYDMLVILHEFSEPFGEDVAAVLGDAIKQYNAGGMSTETLLEQSYLIKDAKLEMERLTKESEEKMARYQQQQTIDAFGVAE